MKFTKFNVVTLFCFFLVFMFSYTMFTKQVEVSMDQNIRYILQWTLPNTIPFVEMKAGREAFFEQKCSFTNCFVTANRSFLKKITDYDIVVFHGPELARNQYDYTITILERDPRQKYVFVSIESSAYYPIHPKLFHSFFNWTWTYKLNSDLSYAYFAVKDTSGVVVAPKENVKWISQSDMDPINALLKDKLRTKRKAAAWIVSNCDAKSKRQTFVTDLKENLKQYGLTVDVYGLCGTLQCPVLLKCLQLVERDYYFYLSLENSFSPDYVTEKLLTAVQHDAVPVVFGGANYSRFLPPGSYLDAIDLGPARLAERMHELISNPEAYHDMFRWRNHYSYHDSRDSPDTNHLCALCRMLNDQEAMGRETVYKRIDQWWNVK